MTLVLRQRCQPNQRLDLSPLRPDALARLSERQIAGIAIGTTRERVDVGEIFEVWVGEPDHLVIEGSSSHFDNVGSGLADGALTVAGEVGLYAGCGMSGGRLDIGGDAGHWAGSAMTGGVLEIGGDAGDRLGGARSGESQGMDGGVLVVRGSAGDRAGDRQRRGIIVVEGGAGANAASRMLAGTLVICGPANPSPGYLMRRGTVVLGQPCALAATFGESGAHDLVIMRLLLAQLRLHSRKAAAVLKAPLRRFCGDMAVLGKGEIFVPGG